MLVRAGSSPSPRRELSSSGQRLPVRLERVADDAVVPPALVRDDLARVRPSPRAKAHRCGMNAPVWPFGDQAHNTVAAPIGPTPNSSRRSGRQPRMMATIAF